MTRFNIVFFGTPDFAVPSLATLDKSGHKVLRVVTQPDRPKGRGRKLTPPPVKLAAMKYGADLLQPESIRDQAFLDEMRQLDPDFFVVVAFGRILPESLLTIPRRGTINVHASLLPKYRGSAPIQWALINGEAETGVTTMLLDKGMDTGDILFKQATAIEPTDTAATLHHRLSEMGASLLAETLSAYAAGKVTPIKQDNDQATCAPILKKSDGHIDWEMPAEKIDTFIRGMHPWPGAFTFLGKRRLKIISAHPVKTDEQAPSGTVLRCFSDELCVATGSGALSIDEIQGKSGKHLSVAEFLRGCPMPPGTLLS